MRNSRCEVAPGGRVCTMLWLLLPRHLRIVTGGSGVCWGSGRVLDPPPGHAVPSTRPIVAVGPIRVTWPLRLLLYIPRHQPHRERGRLASTTDSSAGAETEAE